MAPEQIRANSSIGGRTSPRPGCFSGKPSSGSECGKAARNTRSGRASSRATCRRGPRPRLARLHRRRALSFRPADRQAPPSSSADEIEKASWTCRPRRSRTGRSVPLSPGCSKSPRARTGGQGNQPKSSVECRSRHLSGRGRTRREEFAAAASCRPTGSARRGAADGGSAWAVWTGNVSSRVEHFRRRRARARAGTTHAAPATTIHGARSTCSCAPGHGRHAGSQRATRDGRPAPGGSHRRLAAPLAPSSTATPKRAPAPGIPPAPPAECEHPFFGRRSTARDQETRARSVCD